MSKFKQQDTRPLGSPQSWARTPGTYISAQAHIGGVDHVAVEMELKWGVGRLRLLVSPELREKFDRQAYLLNQAIWHGEVEDVRREASRMTTAWLKLDHAAHQAGAPLLCEEVWEVALEDGTVVAIVKDAMYARAVTPSGRKLAVYTLEEIGRMLSNYRAVTDAKLTFPGATVTIVRRPSDPLDNIRDTLGGLDDPIDDIPSMMAG
jgi:hypothetical protein